MKFDTFTLTMDKFKILLLATVAFAASSCSRQNAISKAYRGHDSKNIAVTETQPGNDGTDICNFVEETPSLPNTFALSPLLPPVIEPVKATKHLNLVQKIAKRKIEKPVTRTMANTSHSSVTASNTLSDHTTSTSFLTLGLILLLAGIVVGVVFSTLG